MERKKKKNCQPISQRSNGQEKSAVMPSKEIVPSPTGCNYVGKEDMLCVQFE